MKGLKTNWSDEMIDKLKTEFPNRFSRDIGKDMGISIRTVIRKARELNLEKIDNFLDQNRNEITRLAQENKQSNPMKGVKGFVVPGGEKHQFKKGHTPKNNPEQSRITRNETIHREKLRIKYGLPQKTKLNLKNVY